MIEIDLPINTDLLRLRRFRPSDRKAFLAFMLDPDCTKFLMFPDELKTEAGASGLLDQVIAAYDSEDGTATGGPSGSSMALCGALPVGNTSAV